MENLIQHSILSGFLVGIGVVVQLSVDNQYIGAMLFSIALLTIIKCSLKLYTGKIGYVKHLDRKEDNLFCMFLCNILGVITATVIGLVVNTELIDAFISKGVIKFSKTYLQLFFSGAMCGVLMLVAVYCKETIITVFCIMTFILSGYEHCIASFPYLVLATSFSLTNILKFLCIVAGNSLGAICAYQYLFDQKEVKKV